MESFQSNSCVYWYNVIIAKIQTYLTDIVDFTYLFALRMVHLDETGV